MAERQSFDPNTQINRMLNPMQHFSEVMLNGFERVTDFQIEMMHASTHYAFQQWQNAIELRGPWSVEEYFSKQRDATEEFGRRITEEMRELAKVGQQLTSEATRTARKESNLTSELFQRGAQRTRSATERMADTAQRQTERMAEQAQQTADRMARGEQEARRSEQQQTRGDGGTQGQTDKFPIDNYDELTVEDIENRLDSLDQDDIRRLRDYERKNKNRKTLSDAFERKL